MKGFIKSSGFTLAEVLITLGIIGVVAALTIPQLHSANRKHVIETRLAKFYSTINQALMLAEDEYGEREGWEPVRPGSGVLQDDEGHYIEGTPTEWTKKYLLPFLKGDAKLSEHDGRVYVQFMDGSMLSVNGWAFIYYPEGIKYDKEGNMTNIIDGVNLFTFYYEPTSNEGKARFTGRNVEPYKWEWNGTLEGLKNGYYGCYEYRYSPAYCAALIQQNGWKIPNDYPYKF